MRGSNTLFNDIFTTPEAAVKQRKGRSSTLIAKRNECLIDRYYFFCKFHEKRYDVVLRTLSAEFFISSVTIPEIIDENFALLANLKKEAPAEIYFKKKWPHLSWSNPPVQN